METIKKRVMEYIDDQKDDCSKFVQKLVQHPSTLGDEASIQQLMFETFLRMGLEVDRWEPDLHALSSLPGFSPVEWSYEGRPNVVGVLKSKTRTGRSLILNGHVDVVSPEPIGHWSHPPWEGSIEGGKLYGRGAADMKAGLAQIVFALKAIQNSGIQLNGDLILQSVIEEECTGNGTLACLNRDYRAHGALIPEPFGLNAIIAQVGVLWLRVKVKGMGAHVLGASKAVNAIEKAYTLIQALKDLENQFNEEEVHPLYQSVDHPINFNVGIVRGGDWPSTVPSECIFEVRLSCFPGVSLEGVKNRIQNYLLEFSKKDHWLAQNPPEFKFYGFHAEGATFQEDNPIFEVLGEIHKQVTGNPLRHDVTTATTDARFFKLYYGIPVTCYGPSGGNLHGPDEFVDLESLIIGTQVIALFIMDWCGYERG